MRGDTLDGGIWPETLYESYKKETNLSSKNSSGVT